MQFFASSIARVTGDNKYGTSAEVFESVLLTNNPEVLELIYDCLYDEECDTPTNDTTACGDAAPGVVTVCGDPIPKNDVTPSALAPTDTPVEKPPSPTPDEAQYNQRLLERQITTDINTAHGTANETSLYDLYHRETGRIITNRQQKFSKTYNVDGAVFTVNGIIDGMDGDSIVELKSRVGRITRGYNPRGYELPQLLFYCDLAKCTRIKVYEEKGGRTKTTHVSFDDYTELFAYYLRRIAAYIQKYNSVICDTDFLIEYLQASPLTRDNMITVAFASAP